MTCGDALSKNPTNVKTKSRQDTNILQRHEQSLPSPLSATFLPKKSWLTENPAWLHDAGELPRNWVLPLTCLIFLDKMLYQEKHQIGFQLAQLSAEGMLDEPCQHSSTSPRAADCFPSQAERASSTEGKKKNPTFVIFLQLTNEICPPGCQGFH